MELIDLILLNCNDNDNIVLVDSDSKEIILQTTCLNEYLLKRYYYKQVAYIGVSNDMGTNLLVFIDL